MAKILIVSFAFSKRGGIEYLAQLVRQSLKEEYSVNCIARNSKFRIGRIYQDFRAIIGLQKVDIAIFMHPFLFRKYASFIPSKVKSIVWTHGREIFGKWGKYQTPNLSSASQIIAVSSYTKTRVLENWPKANVEVINNAAPIPERKYLEQDLNKKKDLIIVSRMASDVIYKGHEIVFNALSLLQDFNIKYFPTLHVVGDGNDRPRLERIVESLDFSDKVLFHGYVTEEKLENLYSTSLAFVMPSFVKKNEEEKWGGEGFGLVYLEAGLHQLPVIACDEGGQTDCIINGKTGFLVKPDAEAVANKIALLLNDPYLAWQMGKAGYQHVLKRFTFNRFRKDVLQLIEGYRKENG